MTTTVSIENDVIDKHEAARILRRSVSWLDKAARRGDVPSFKLGGARMYRRSSLAKLIATLEEKERRGVSP